MKKILITSYISPDIDGYACAYAYEELLKRKGSEVIAGISGNPHREVNFVLNTFDIKPLPQAQALNSKIILVDASDLKGISPEINPVSVIEVIDHRKVNDADQFSKAKVQIEFVGAAATLIAEKFYQDNMSPSKEAAALLYSAIVSNTINFKNNVTTKRDKAMAKWLLGFFTLPQNYIKKMFISKSQFTKTIKEIFREDYLRSNFGGKSVSIFQLEIVNVKDFLQSHIDEIKQTLLEFKEDERFYIVFLTAIDIFEGYNMFVVVDSFTENIVSQTLGVSFEENIAKREGIIMRKEILPLIKAFLEASS